jgi:hypothetical protein
MERLPLVDRICLRMAVCELKNYPDIPMRVTLNEYIEIVRLFSTDESPQYINAVLDRLAQKFPKKDFQIQQGEKNASASSAQASSGGESTQSETPIRS